MSKHEVWIVFTKNEALDDCSIDVDGCDYYFVEAFVPVSASDASNQLDGIVKRVKAALAEDYLELKAVSKCLLYKPQEWQADTVLNKEINKYAQKAMATGLVEFGSFRSEEIEELTQIQLVMDEQGAQ
ncbi:MAG TPA: hypothetical protein VIZ65_18075 [Cellvibrionaceae bacterium]